MKTMTFARLARPTAVLLTCLVAACCALGAELSEAEKAWEEFQLASRNPPQPKEWRTQRPTREEYNQYLDKVRETLNQAAAKARDFYTRFPNDPNAPRAQRKEYEFLNRLVSMGETKLEERLAEMEKKRLADPALPEEDRFDIRSQQLDRRVRARQAEGTAALIEEMEKGARELQKEFPNKPEIYEKLLTVAEHAAPEKGRALAQELIKDARSPQGVKERASAMLRKLEALGKPLELEFTAVDGRKVDLAGLKGKVVLVDFWATWCGPCIAELPNVLKAYEELHPKGFEIIGISFDGDKDALEKFVKENKMTWPQFFDGKRWGNKYGQEFGINAIPAMWLVDKKGVLVDMNARANLADKVKKLLAE